MSFTLAKRYSRQDARNARSTLFVFGDNMARAGFGGQAKEMRGEINAVGIPTKWRPARDEGAYFADADFELTRDGDGWALDTSPVQKAIDAAFDQLEAHRKAGGSVVWPTDGVGTGLAALQTRAPAIYAYIAFRRDRLETL